MLLVIMVSLVVLWGLTLYVAFIYIVGYEDSRNERPVNISIILNCIVALIFSSLSVVCFISKNTSIPIATSVVLSSILLVLSIAVCFVLIKIIKHFADKKFYEKASEIINNKNYFFKVFYYKTSFLDRKVKNVKNDKYNDTVIPIINFLRILLIQNILLFNIMNIVIFIMNLCMASPAVPKI